MKILHIDDNKMIIQSFANILELVGHEVESCSDSKTGLNRMLEEKFDVIILDLTMPSFSGFDILQELADRGSTENNIFALTAMTLTDQQRSFLFEKGVKKILLKPLGIDELLEEIKDYQLKVKSD